MHHAQKGTPTPTTSIISPLKAENRISPQSASACALPVACSSKALPLHHKPSTDCRLHYGNNLLTSTAARKPTWLHGSSQLYTHRDPGPQQNLKLSAPHSLKASASTLQNYPLKASYSASCPSSQTLSQAAPLYSHHRQPPWREPRGSGTATLAGLSRP